MEERRIHPRRRVLKSGQVPLGNNSVINCTVRDLSDHGARIELGAPWAVPRDFILVIEGGSFKRRCHVVRGNAKYLGVAFD